MKALLLIQFALVPLLSAQDRPAVNQEHVRTAAAWLISPEPSKRKAAILTFRTMPAEAMPQYKSALDFARNAHLDRIKKIDKGDNPLSEQDAIARQLDDERKRVMPLILTDYKKNHAKVQMLRTEMKGLISLYSKREKAQKRDIAKLQTAVNDSLDALCEITRELEKFNPQQDSHKFDAAELRQHLIKNSLEADHLIQLQTSWSKSEKEMAQLADVEKLNAENAKWCNPSMKSFATTLNYERVVMGLVPLRIEEKLSTAAEGHSSDMAAGDFFDHESPVPNKKMPWDRARLAQFAGQFTGENIFMGSEIAQDAYDAWFSSDGHRFIMFAEGPNCCGIGISGNHWTLMTGSQ